MYAMNIKNLKFKETNHLIGILVVIWTLIIAASLVWNILQSTQHILEFARIEARTAFEKDTIYSMSLMNMDKSNQVHRMARQESAVLGHITSLKSTSSKNGDKSLLNASNAFE